jgi:hypothetical protein
MATEHPAHFDDDGGRDDESLHAKRRQHARGEDRQRQRRRCVRPVWKMTTNPLCTQNLLGEYMTTTVAPADESGKLIAVFRWRCSFYFRFVPAGSIHW